MKLVNCYHPRSGWYYFWSRRSICLCVCLSCSCSNFRKPWPRNFIFGMEVHLQNIYRPSSYVKVIGLRSRSHEPKNGIYERLRVVRLRLEGKLVVERWLWRPADVLYRLSSLCLRYKTFFPILSSSPMIWPKFSHNQKSFHYSWLRKSHKKNERP